MYKWRCLGLILTLLSAIGCKDKKKMDVGQFQDFVLEVVQKEFPAQKFRKGTDAETLLSETQQFGLTNLYRKYELEESSIKSEIIDSFKEILTSKQADKKFSWEQAKVKLRPQITHKDYLKVQPKLAYTPLAVDLILAYVLDLGSVNQYVTTDDVTEWKRTQKDIYEISLQNLEGISKGLAIQAMGNDIVIIATSDSYDAVRALLPRLQTKMQERLGTEFRIGIPNRDFLIFWSKRLDAEGVRKLQKQVSEDFAKMPYPLTEKILVLSGSQLKELKD